MKLIFLGSSTKNYIGSIICIFLLLSCKTKENRIERMVLTKESKSSDSLKLEKQIPLHDVKGRIDHLAVDDSSSTLYVAALGNNSIEVIDLKTGSVVKSIKDIEEPQSIVLIEDKNMFCVSSGGSGECKFYDSKNYSLIKNLKLGSDADNMRFDNNKKLLYAGYGDGTIAVIDINNLSLINSVKLSGHPESFQIDKRRNKIYVNVPHSESIEVIDLTQNTVTGSWKLKDASSNFPMALDETNNLLFIGCRNPAIMLVYDIRSGKEINRFEIKGDIDDIFLDTNTDLLYLTCGSGYLQVFKKESSGIYELRNEIETSKGARTGLLELRNNNFFLAQPQSSGENAKISIYKLQ